jgi:uncharacterized protein (TIGR01319 family)
MNAALLVDFGSTYTKVRAVALGEGRVVASAQGPSTVTTDVAIGLEFALTVLQRHLGQLPRWRYRLASSSAAGGLRMVTVGLVRELTAEAARQAALGAGAKLVGCYAYRLTTADLRQIEALAPDVLLLCGGTDGGNAEVIVHNARRLASSALACPIVAAGNREAAEEVTALLPDAIVAGNVMPELNVLRIDPARRAIRDLFMQRIVQAKGIDRVRGMLDSVLMPTPAAVLEGARLLAAGPGGGGLGPLVVLDPGGATTDVHSIADGAPAQAGVVAVGLPEPHDKRTVEGDLGMRHNAASICDTAGYEAVAADAGLPLATVRLLVQRIHQDVERLPGSPEEEALERAAVSIAMRRHAGRRETVFTATGPVLVQHGKDLTAVRTVVGTGGVIVASQQPRRLLERALHDPAEPQSLCPRDAQLLIDRDYALYACGLLAQAEPKAAFALARNSLQATLQAEALA